MSDISNVLRKVIELDISLGLDGTQEALDEITRLTAEVERLLSVTVVQETLIREAEAENEKLRAALEKIVEIRSYRKAEAGELFEIARAALAAAINSWPRIKIHTDGTEDWIELTLTQEKL